MRTRASGQPAIGESRVQTRENASSRDVCLSSRGDQRGFTMAELMIAMAVFTLIIGSVGNLLGKSQTIFRTAPSVSGIDQDARLLIGFLNRDIQPSQQHTPGL